MTLYHGSNVDIQKIEFSKCRPNKDFGKGFYLTSIKEQAERIALLFRQFSGGLISVETLVNEMEFKKLTDQYSFHTEKELSYLFKTGVENV